MQEKYIIIVMCAIHITAIRIRVQCILSILYYTYTHRQTHAHTQSTTFHCKVHCAEMTNGLNGKAQARTPSFVPFAKSKNLSISSIRLYVYMNIFWLL